MKESALCSCALLSSLMWLLAPLPLFGVDSPTKNSGINPADTYVTFDESVVTQSIFVQPMANDGAVPRANPVRSRTFHVEEGYDTAGNFILNLTLLTRSPTIGHGAVKAKLSNGKVQFFDHAGLPVLVPYADALGPDSANLSTMVLTDHLPIQNIQAYAKACSAKVVSGSVPNGNSGQDTVTLQMPMRGKGGTFTKTFEQSGHGWILTQMGFSHYINNGTTASVITYSNVSWHHNAADDSERRSLEKRSLKRQYAPMPFRAQALSSSGSQASVVKPSSCPTTVSHLGGPQNVVFQHGLEGNSCSWNNSSYPMTAALNSLLSFGTEIVPSLPSTEALASQTSSLVSLLESTGGSHYILIGHSQGGLISRSAAQYFQTNSPSTVSGVITVDTPNLGAPIINNTIGGAANVLGGYLNNILADILDPFDCYDEDDDYGPYCSIGSDDPYGGGTLYSLLAAGGYNIVNEAIAAAGIYTLNSAWPATEDLEPGSSFLSQLNSFSENFVRVGIVSDSVDDIYGPFLPEHLGGDFISTATGQFVVEGFQTADLALLAGIAYYNAEADSDCDDDPDGDACYDDEAYVAQYATIDNDIFVPDAYWDPLPLPNECCDFSDGIVNGQSEYYPNVAKSQDYYIPAADTHVGSTKSSLVAAALYTALEHFFFVPVSGCTFSISSSGLTEGSAGSKGTLTITTQSGCEWSISSNVNWITFTPATGTGSATITYTVAANASGPRAGELVVAGATIFTVTQEASVAFYWPAIQYLLGQ